MKFPDFKTFKNELSAQFNKMSETSRLFATATDNEVIWQTYLSAFPEGHDPVFRVRTFHDGSYDRHFIRQFGNTVAFIDNELVTMWDGEFSDENYAIVAKKMSEYVKSCPISNVFLTDQRNAGHDDNKEMIDNKVHTYNHFQITIPRVFVVNRADIETLRGNKRTEIEMLEKSIFNISLDAVDTVLELISQNSIYRGEEHKGLVTEFRKILIASRKTNARNHFLWKTGSQVSPAVCRIKNTVIGSLLEDLSSGVDLERAVASFESKVAPANYKRPKSLVTENMVKAAKEKIADLGLTNTIGRRFANVTDIKINNILFANRQSKAIIEKDIFDSIETQKPPKNFKKVEEISIEKFLSDIVPNSSKIEIFFENRHQHKMVSLIAPLDGNAGNMLKWDNNFSWAYNGDVADSMKEKVKLAGGNVSGEFCCRLAWYNGDDLDLHMHEPNHHIYYGTKYSRSPSGGQLDVDMNAGGVTSEAPVENIFYQKISTMKPGTYTLSVNQYNNRSSQNVGFDVEVDILGETFSFSYPQKVTGTVKVATFDYSLERGLVITGALKASSSSKTKWGIATNDFHSVNVMMLSPNHWDGQGVGNKHYFFFLDKCINEDTPRGFYNEFLREDLNEHRKVFEIVGSKATVQPSVDQLSGIGFSSTDHTDFKVRVTGKTERIFKVKI